MINLDFFSAHLAHARDDQQFPVEKLDKPVSEVSQILKDNGVKNTVCFISGIEGTPNHYSICISKEDLPEKIQQNHTFYFLISDTGDNSLKLNMFLHIDKGDSFSKIVDIDNQGSELFDKLYAFVVKWGQHNGIQIENHSKVDDVPSLSK